MSNPVGREVDRRPTTLLLNGKDVSWEILSEEVSKGSSVVAVHKEVREALVIKQQEIARTKNVVMEGRDTTFRVLPDAQLKVFLTAREPERAKRRHQQLLERGEDVDYKQVLGDLKKRDERDSNRKVDPLHVVQDAWVLDTTDLTVSAVVDKILQRVHELT